MTKLKKSLYEGMYIVNAMLSEDSRKKALDKILHGIQELGGEVHKVHEMGRKKLAYAIAKKREGYYYLIYFTVPTAAIAELWKGYHLHEDLLRFMTLRCDEVKETLTFKPLKSAER
jgi:small subunit ribosomal protein S6